MHSHRREEARATAWRLLVVALLTLTAILVIPHAVPAYLLRWLTLGAFLGAQAAAFDFTAGYINIANFGFCAIGGAGAYTSAILSNTLPVIKIRWGLPPWVTIPLGALVSGLIGLCLGALTLRLRGIFAAIMAWFVGLALISTATNLTDITRGERGLIVRPLVPDANATLYFYLVCFLLIGFVIVLKLVGEKTHLGLACKAIGQDVDAAKSCGVNPTRYRILNFTISCALAGLILGIYGHYIRILTPNALMHTSRTVEVLAVSYIAGRGSIWGGAVLAIPLTLMREFLRVNFPHLPELHLLIYGLLLIIVTILWPRGLVGAITSVVERLRLHIITWLRPSEKAGGGAQPQ